MCPDIWSTLSRYPPVPVIFVYGLNTERFLATLTSIEVTVSLTVFRLCRWVRSTGGETDGRRGVRVLLKQRYCRPSAACPGGCSVIARLVTWSEKGHPLSIDGDEGENRRWAEFGWRNVPLHRSLDCKHDFCVSMFWWYASFEKP